jgi:hypothetical protein
LVVDVSDAVSVEYCLFLSPVRAVQFPVVFMCFVFPSGFGRSSYGRADSISRTDSIGQVSMAPRRSGAWHHAGAAHGTTPERRMAPRRSGAWHHAGAAQHQCLQLEAGYAWRSDSISKSDSYGMLEAGK